MLYDYCPFFGCVSYLRARASRRFFLESLEVLTMSFHHRLDISLVKAISGKQLQFGLGRFATHRSAGRDSHSGVSRDRFHLLSEPRMIGDHLLPKFFYVGACPLLLCEVS